jgi:hypothetical protein
MTEKFCKAEEYLCDIEGCKIEATYLISHDTYCRGQEYPSATFIGMHSCGNHIDEVASELIEEYGEPNGDDVEMTITEVPTLREYPCMHTECFNSAKFQVDMLGGGTVLCEKHLWIVLDNKENYGYLGQVRLSELEE